MFSKSLDNKGIYVKNGIKLKDLTESIFKSNLFKYSLFSYYRVSKDLEMRPDKISKSLYGSEDYVEIVMKHSSMDNPFAIEEGDILVAPSLTTIYTGVKDLKDYETEDTERNISTYDLIKNYHKYIDKSKIPSKIGSDNIDLNISKNNQNNKASSFNDFDLLGVSLDNNGNVVTSPSSTESNGEANLANNGYSGITIKNGRIYFGPNVSAKSDNILDIKGSNKVDNDLVDCAKNGVTLGQFLTSVVKNNLKNGNSLE